MNRSMGARLAPLCLAVAAAQEWQRAFAFEDAALWRTAPDLTATFREQDLVRAEPPWPWNLARQGRALLSAKKENIKNRSEEFVIFRK